MEIKSPLTNSNRVKLERTIKTAYLINEWNKSDIDISRFFKNINDIYLYKCLDTGYKFFYPLNLEGDNKFYEDLQKFSWYYMDWKWEYEQTIKLIKPEFSVLEIGCGPGDFLSKLKEKNIKCIGLEFNDAAIKKCQEKNLSVHKETIQEHAKENKDKYDLVCSFQVMEHIAKIREAIKASVETVKPGGLLVISVPNDDSFMKHDPLNLMETPPHHMARWNKKSLESLEKIFKIKLLDIYFEPLQSYHYRYYYKVMFGNKIEKIFGKFGEKINKILSRVSLHFLTKKYYPKIIKGHTIMAIYQKNA